MNGIRRMLIATVTLAVVATAAPVGAHVAEVTASVPLAEVKDSDSLHRTIAKAVDKARSETIAFEPSVVAVTGVRVLGERVLIGLLFADKDGEAILRELRGSLDGEGRPGPDDPGDDGAGLRELRI